jgi:hypothetical protein
MLEQMRAQRGRKDPSMTMTGPEYHFTALKRLPDSTQPDDAR